MMRCKPKIKQAKDDCQVPLTILVHVLVLVVSFGEFVANRGSMIVGIRRPRCDYGDGSIIIEDE